MIRPLPLAATATLAGAALLLTGCSSAQSSSTSSGAQGAGGHITIKLTGDGSGSTCTPSRTSVPAGPVTFTVRNISAPAVSEVELQSDQRILGEKENLAPGLDPVSFTVTLDGGTYQLYCPGATKEMQNLTVTGKAAAQTGDTAELLKTGATEYKGYVDQQIASLVTSTNALDDAIQAGDLDRARTLYGQARPYYERIESDVEGFVLSGYKATDNHGHLDYLIDMRQSNLDPAVGWHGFHAVERELFEVGSITDTAKQASTELRGNVSQLQKRAAKLTYKPEDLANGAADLLEEVQSNKITGEEEAFSHIDLADFAGNVEGAQEAFAYLKPGLQKINAASVKEISTQFSRVTGLLAQYQDSSAIGGYRTYDGTLKSEAAAKLSKAVQALQDPLAGLAAKVAKA
jgi:iron uptake system component EfeO